ncbi:hypothetical protein AVEN_229287-1 [Araneus ventricosus]|uniref:Uncharacterized protein n=1 Tax=Araneus ventricosus TaxID=182803 RepID=A0A4Y2S342_ARAVE|nr:hypothetical protein AVEN_229287-1 [Araneus ventricosus]
MLAKLHYNVMHLTSRLNGDTTVFWIVHVLPQAPLLMQCPAQNERQTHDNNLKQEGAKSKNPTVMSSSLAMTGRAAIDPHIARSIFDVRIDKENADAENFEGFHPLSLAFCTKWQGKERILSNYIEDNDLNRRIEREKFVVPEALTQKKVL